MKLLDTAFSCQRIGTVSKSDHADHEDWIGASRNLEAGTAALIDEYQHPPKLADIEHHYYSLTSNARVLEHPTTTSLPRILRADMPAPLQRGLRGSIALTTIGGQRKFGVSEGSTPARRNLIPSRWLDLESLDRDCPYRWLNRLPRTVNFWVLSV